MRKTLGVVALVLFWAVPAQADLILAGTVGGVNFCARDNGAACGFGVQLTDLDATVGRLSLGPTLLGGLDVQGSLHLATIGLHNVLNSSSLQITNTTGAFVGAVVAVSATDFLGPITEASVSGSGTWEDAPGSNITMRWFNDPANQQGGSTPFDTPGLLLDTFFDGAGLGVDSFAHNGGPFPVNAPGLFSMTLAFDMTLAPNGRLVSRGQTQVADVTAVPEPASMLLFGAGLVGLAVRVRKRTRP